MPTVKKYIDTDVLTEARARASHIYDTHDNIVVAFSGGKDSLCCLHLMLEQAEARGRTLDVAFRDEELIPGSVLDVIDHYRQHPGINLRWYALPMESHKYILGRTIRYVQWDPAREWVRPKPPWAVTEKDIGMPASATLDQRAMDAVLISGLRGKVAIVLGIRASESIVRYRSVVNKLNENYIVASSSKRAVLAKPVYDWELNDVLKYIVDTGAVYCRHYDAQTWAGDALRINSALTSEASKSSLQRLRQTDPVLYDRVVTLFPEVTAQERYWRELDVKGLNARHGSTYTTIRDWVEHNLEGRQRTAALKHLAEMELLELRVGGYPAAYAWSTVKSGEVTKRLPVPQRQAA